MRGTPKLSARRPEGYREQTLDEALRCEGMDEAAWARAFEFYLDHACGRLREVKPRENESGSPGSSTKSTEGAKSPAIEIDWKAFNETLKEWARHLERTESSLESEPEVIVQLEHKVPRPNRALTPAPNSVLPSAPPSAFDR